MACTESKTQESTESKESEPMSDAIVLLSGGLDSTTALALASRNHDQILGLSFAYGQRHEEEVKAAAVIAEYFGIDHRVVEVKLGKGDSVLMNHQKVMPHMTYEEIEKSEGVSPTYVPYRNGTFLSHAASVAVGANYDTIYAGVHAEDARGWAYPDCTPEFIGAMQNAIYVGTYHKVRLVAPFQYKMKHEIIEVGLKLNAPYHLTLSCYEGQSPACGRCPTCVSRLEAFKANGVRDPIAYEFDKYGSYESGKIVTASLQLNHLLGNDAA
jgi:7-cyano-7-deazaguanine synthase